MALTIYKPGQGYWTRVLSAIGAGTLLLAGAGWLHMEIGMGVTDAGARNIAQIVAVILVVLLGGGGLFLLLNRMSVVDFMIATEAEMRKVNWPTRREVILSTWVVIVGTFLICLLLWLVNLAFGWLFTYIGIIKLPD